MPKLFSSIDVNDISAVGVSAAPRCEEGSYMPVFLCGASFAATLSGALGVPLYRFSHQQGHIAAATDCGSAAPRTAIHLSGGTTELVDVGADYKTSRVGGTSDLSAGQFVDRIGVALGLGFPAGKELEKLAANGSDSIKLPSSVKGCECSFSGAESRLAAMLSDCIREDAAYAVYDCISRTLVKLMLNRAALTGDNAFLLAGGVASSALLRSLVSARAAGRLQLTWGDAATCSDNAVGAARLAMLKSAGREVRCVE